MWQIAPWFGQEYDRFSTHNFFWSIVGSINFGGPLVLAAWTALVMAGRWRPEPTWTDRGGRFIGAFSMLFYATFWIKLPW